MTSNNNPPPRHLKVDDYIWDEPRVTEDRPKTITPPPPLKRKSWTGRLKNARIVDSDFSDDDCGNAISLEDPKEEECCQKEKETATDEASFNEIGKVKRCDVRINKEERRICQKFLAPHVPDNVSACPEPGKDFAPSVLSPTPSTSSTDTSESSKLKDDTALESESKGTLVNERSQEHSADLDDDPPVICLDDQDVAGSESPRKRKWTINQYETLLSKRKRVKSKDDDLDIKSKSEPVSNKSSDTSKTGKDEKKNEEDSTSTLENDENVWYNGNTYSCKPCSFETHKRALLDSHIEKEHKTTASRWQKNIRKTDNKYTCNVCSHVTRHDEEDIRRHVETEHMLDLAMYGRLYVTNIKLLRENSEKRKLEEAAGKSPARNKKGDEEKSLLKETETLAQSKTNSEKEEVSERKEKEIATSNADPSSGIESLEPKHVEPSKSFKIPKITKTAAQDQPPPDGWRAHGQEGQPRAVQHGRDP